MTQTNAWRNRLLILSIALLCILPFSFAWYLAKNPQLLKSRQTTNLGHLVSPARPLDYDGFTQSPLATANLAEIKGHWVIVQVVGAPDCAAPCLETLQKTAKVRSLLNKDTYRVRHLLLFLEAANAESVPPLTEQNPGLLVTGLHEPLQQQLQEAVGKPLTEGMVLLLDPQTNLMMWYEPGTDPLNLLRDLQKLLRISQIG